MVTARGPGVAPDQQFPLLIAVAASPEERVRLTAQLDGVAPLLLVGSLDELRRLLAPGDELADSPFG